MGGRTPVDLGRAELRGIEMIEKKYENHLFRERFNRLIFSAHKVQGLTNKKIAQDLGISWSAMAYYKSGKTLPATEVLIRIADYFGVSTDYLLGREGYELGD